MIGMGFVKNFQDLAALRVVLGILEVLCFKHNWLYRSEKLTVPQGRIFPFLRVPPQYLVRSI